MYAVQYHFFKIRLPSILPSKLRSSKLFLSLRYFLQIRPYVSFLPHICQTPSPNLSHFDLTSRLIISEGVTTQGSLHYAVSSSTIFLYPS